jgi:hypothetical protein
MRRFRNRDGFIKPILIIVVLLLAAYAGLELAVPYYRYSAFKSDVKEITRIGLGNVEKTKAQVYEAAQEYKIPVEEDDIVVTKKMNTMRVQTSWSATVDIFGIYQKTFNFSVDVEE